MKKLLALLITVICSGILLDTVAQDEKKPKKETAKAKKEVKPGSTCVMELSGNKKVAYSREDRFLLANLDLPQRFAGYGFPKLP